MNFIPIIIIAALAALLVYTPNKLMTAEQQSSVQDKIPDVIDNFFLNTLGLNKSFNTLPNTTLNKLGMSICTADSQCRTTYPNNANVVCKENYCYGL